MYWVQRPQKKKIKRKKKRINILWCCEMFLFHNSIQSQTLLLLLFKTVPSRGDPSSVCIPRGRSPERHFLIKEAVQGGSPAETHLCVPSETRVDSLWWFCSLQWLPQLHGRAYIPPAGRNMMHRLCNGHCAWHSRSSGSKNVSSRQSCSIYVHLNEDA